MDIVPSQTPAAQSRQRAGLATFPCFAQASCVQQAKAPSTPRPVPGPETLRRPQSQFPSAALPSCPPAFPVSGSSGIKGLWLPMGH